MQDNKHKLNSEDAEKIYADEKFDTKKLAQLRKKFSEEDTIEDLKSDVEEVNDEINDKLDTLDSKLFDGTIWSKTRQGGLTGKILGCFKPDINKQINKNIGDYKAIVSERKRAHKAQVKELDAMQNELDSIDSKRFAADEYMMKYQVIEKKLRQREDELIEERSGYLRKGEDVPSELLDKISKVRKDSNNAKKNCEFGAKEFVKFDEAHEALSSLYANLQIKADENGQETHYAEMLEYTLDTVNKQYGNSGTKECLKIIKTVQTETVKGKKMEEILGDIMGLYGVSTSLKHGKYNTGVGKADIEANEAHNSGIIDAAMKRRELLYNS